MRRLRSTALALGLCLLGAGPLRAGVYNTAEPDWPPCPTFKQFQLERLIPLRQIGADEKVVQSPGHKRYTLMVNLAARSLPEKMTAEERLNLSAYLIRLQKYKEAIKLLEGVVRQERDNFLLYANLATAQYLEGVTTNSPDFVRRAIDNLAGGALDQWPRDVKSLAKKNPERIVWLRKIGWREKDYEHYRTAEEYFLKLLRLRAREFPTKPQRVTQLGDDVEPLFTDAGKPPQPVRFIGENGRYQRGKIAVGEFAKLPRNAPEIVEQLLTWLPHDNRLYWLLGETLNARGEYQSAFEVFNDLRNRLNLKREEDCPALLGEHWRVVHPEVVNEREIASLTALLVSPQSPGPFLATSGLIVGRLAPELAPSAAEPGAEPAAKRNPTNGSPPPGTTLIDLRSLAVGFGVGLLVAVLGYWQLREIRRRVQARSVARTSPAPQRQNADEPIMLKREGGRPG